MNEILSKRAERCKHFDLGNGQMQYVGFGAPIHYKDAKGDWDNIVLDFQDDGKGNLLTDKNKVSCGFRTDKKLSKYFGLRYDKDHQFEATPVSIILDGVEQLGGTEFTTAAIKETSQLVSNKLNPNVEIVNRLSEVALRNYFKITNPVEDFKITEQIHLKGLTCNNKKDIDKYVPDEKGDFNFVDEKGEFKFGIHPPFFRDTDGIEHFTLQHELVETIDGLFYTKTPTKEGKDDLILVRFPIEVDADTFYSTTADGIVQSTTGAWATVHEETTGASAVSNATSLWAGVTASKTNWYIQRSFLYFDTSTIGAGNTVTAAVLSLYNSATVNPTSVQKGTQAATLTTGDIHAFSGNEYIHITPTANQYNDWTFDAQGRSDIVITGTTKLCVREYTSDYNYAGPSAGQSNFWSAEEDQANERRPRLVVTYTASAAGPAKLKTWNGLATAKIKTINGLAIAKVKTINGLV